MSDENRTTDDRLEHYRTFLIDAINMTLGDAADRHGATERLFDLLLARLRAKLAEDGLDVKERLVLRLLKKMKGKITEETSELIEKLIEKMDADEVEQTMGGEVRGDG